MPDGKVGGGESLDTHGGQAGGLGIRQEGVVGTVENQVCHI